MKCKQTIVIEVSWAHRVLCASGELDDDGLYQLGHANPSNVIYVSCGTTVLAIHVLNEDDTDHRGSCYQVHNFFL